MERLLDDQVGFYPDINTSVDAKNGQLVYCCQCVHCLPEAFVDFLYVVSVCPTEIL